MSISCHFGNFVFFIKATKTPIIGCVIFISMCSVFAFGRQDGLDENFKNMKNNKKSKQTTYYVIFSYFRNFVDQNEKQKME